MVSKATFLISCFMAFVVVLSIKGEARDLVGISSISTMTKVDKEQDGASDNSYGRKVCIKRSGGESSDCFIPGFLGFPGIGIPGLPRFQGRSRMDKIPRLVGDVKYGTKTCVKGSSAESSDCFIPGFPGFPGIPGIPLFPGIPGLGGSPKTPPTANSLNSISGSHA